VNVNDKENGMSATADRQFDWIALLALVSGMAVLLPSLASLAMALIHVGYALI
jgi:hypothetical protein